MDDAEIDRIRKAIRRSFAGSPHKKKYWLTLLEMHVEAEISGRGVMRKPSKESSVRRPSGNSGKAVVDAYGKWSRNPKVGR